MNELKHSPEPWEIRPSKDGYTEILFTYPDTDLKPMIATAYGDNNLEDARRIVACVTACKGVPVEELEKMGADFMECFNVLYAEAQEAKALREGRDSLVKALEDRRSFYYERDVPHQTSIGPEKCMCRNCIDERGRRAIFSAKPTCKWAVDGSGLYSTGCGNGARGVFPDKCPMCGKPVELVQAGVKA